MVKNKCMFKDGAVRSKCRAKETKSDKNIKTSGTKALSKLHMACRNGDTNLVNYFLDRGAKVEAKTRNKARRTPLMCASSSGFVNVVNLLLDRGANVNTFNSNQATALHHACGLLDYDFVAKVLLERGAEINAQTKSGSTPLISSCRAGNEKCVKLLLQYGADAFVLTSRGLTALDRCYYYGHHDLVFLLEDHMRAVIRGSKNVNRHRLTRKENQFICAVRYGWFEEATILLDGKRINTNAVETSGFRALDWACYMGDCKMVNLLLEHGADIEAKSLTKCQTTALIRVSKMGNLDIVRLLLNRGANVNAVNASYASALYIACGFLDYEKDSSNYYSVSQLLVERGANVNSRTRSGRTPLIRSCIAGNVNCVKLLLQSGANPFLSTARGQIALHFANAGKHETIINLLEKRMRPSLLSSLTDADSSSHDTTREKLTDRLAATVNTAFPSTEK